MKKFMSVAFLSIFLAACGTGNRALLKPLGHSVAMATISDAERALFIATSVGDEAAKPCPADIIQVGYKLSEANVPVVEGLLSGIALDRAVHKAITNARPFIDKLNDDCAVYKLTATEILLKLFGLRLKDLF